MTTDIATASNGRTAATEKAIDETAVLPALDHVGSVKRDDFTTGNVVFLFPAYGYGGIPGKSIVLPRTLPAYNRYSFYTHRDWRLLQTVYHESMWANAVATAVTKAAAWGWDIDGVVPLRRKRLQELLMYATAGVFMGWVPFATAHLRSYLLAGRAIVELEREKNRYSSRIVGMHHLNPLRCLLTDNPRYPVQYLDRQGKVHRLAYWQVMIFGDNLDPTEGELQTVNSAAERAYDRITTMEAVHMYLYEKVTGTRPTTLEFIQGLNDPKLRDAITSAEAEQERKGNIMYKGAIITPLMSDIPLNHVSIPIASLPDGFNYQEIHDNTAVIYCGAIGMDVNDLDPRLAQRVNLGSGAQSIMLEQKARGKGLAGWRQDWTQQLHRLAASVATKFVWSENNTDDDLRKAQLLQTRANTRKVMQENQEIDTEESRNLAVDWGDLPKEFLRTDLTAGGVVGSDDNPEDQPEQAAQEAGGQEGETAVAGKEVRTSDDILELIRAQEAEAARIAGRLLQKEERVSV